ncbi:MAG: hypothetical protein K9N35_10695 [Candidatus Marinimicrobia bacterium]|nr:hypothetical protein [Candidatus Neomarinimicrobiota bacterium]
MMNKCAKKNMLMLAIIVTMAIPDTLLAIPAFARRHKVSCNTCHTSFPRLKDYGEEFAGNGFIMKEDEKDRDYVIAGDDLLRLNKDFPLAVRFEAWANYDQDKTVETDLQSPWGIKVLSGGTLAKNVGYYFYFFMNERGEVAGIEDAYIHFDNVRESQLDILVGQFQTSDPLMKRELRLTYEDYMVYKTSIGLSETNLAYDRGVMFMYGIPSTGTDIMAMVVNGNGKPIAVDRRLDKDNYKNLGFRILQGFGDKLSVGAYFYSGKEEILAADNIIRDNSITYFGPDLALGAGPIDLTVQILHRIDSNPLGLATEAEENTEGMVVEAIWGPQGEQSGYFVTALYNYVEGDSYDYHTATLSHTYMMARNLRLVTEYTRDLQTDKNRFELGIISAF